METKFFPMEIMKIARQSVAVALRQAWAAGLCGLAGPLHGLANQEMLVSCEFECLACYNIIIYIHIWVNYNDLTATSLGIMVSIGNHPQMALIQVSEIL